MVESKLKVMLEEDYLAMDKNVCRGGPCVHPHTTHAIASQIVREVVIPELTKEVNQGQNFAQLRQVYNSLILATWYKKKIKDSILNQVYSDKNKVFGLNAYRLSLNAKQIYQRYLQAFKKGAFNYIKDTDMPNGISEPRKYFSGGVLMAVQSKYVHDEAMINSPQGVFQHVIIDLKTSSAAMTSEIIPIKKKQMIYDQYESAFKVWMDDLVRAGQRNPIFLIGGHSGAGKTEFADLFKRFCEAHGHSAVVVHADRFKNSVGLQLKQAIVNYVPFVWWKASLQERLKYLDMIYHNTQTIEKFSSQLSTLSTLPDDQKVRLAVPGYGDKEISPGTIIILEGGFAKRMFPFLKATISLLFQIDSQLAKSRIVKRGVEKGYPLWNSKIDARLSDSNVNRDWFSDGMEGYDYIVNVSNGGPIEVRTVIAENSGGIDFKSDKMNVETKMDSRLPGNDNKGIQFHVNPAMLRQLQDSPGFIPIIVSIQPMTDIKKFLLN